MVKAKQAVDVLEKCRDHHSGKNTSETCENTSTYNISMKKQTKPANGGTRNVGPTRSAITSCIEAIQPTASRHSERARAARLPTTLQLKGVPTTAESRSLLSVIRSHLTASLSGLKKEVRPTDKVLLLTARNIGGVFLPVKGYFSSKNRGW